MAEGNQIPITIDIATLKTQAEEVKQIFIDLFAQLEKYGKTAISPINIAGLTELSESIKASNTELSKLNTLIGTLNTTTKAYNKTQSDANKTKAEAAKFDREYEKALQQEQKDLIASTKAYDLLKAKVKDLQNEYIRLKNIRSPAAKDALVELQVAEKQLSIAKQDLNTQKELATLRTQVSSHGTRESEEKAALLVQNKELQRQEVEAAQENNSLFQQRKAQSDAEKKAKLDEAQAKRDSTKAGKESEQQQKKEQTQAYQLTQAYTNLKREVDQKKQAYVSALKQHGADSPITKAAQDDLAASKNQLDAVNKSIGETGTGAAQKYGKALTGLFSQVRQLAYILPGIGIAGIFDLAIQAVTELISRMFNANTLVEEMRDIDIETNQAIQKQIELDKELYEIQEKLYQLEKLSSESQKKRLEEREARGYSTDVILPLKAAEANTKLAETVGKLQDLSLQVDPDKAVETLRKQARESQAIVDINDERIKQADSFIERSKIMGAILKDIGARTGVDVSGLAIGAISEAVGGGLGRGEKFKDVAEAEALKKQWEAQINTNKSMAQRNLEAINEYDAALSNSIQVANSNARQKEIEAAEKRLAEAKKNAAEIILVNELIAKSPLSSEQEILAALDIIYQQKAALLRFQLTEYQHDINHSDAQKKVKAKETEEALTQLTLEGEDEREKIRTEFRRRDLEATKNIAIEKAEAQLKLDETVFQDETRGLNDRLGALEDYIKQRKAQLDAQIEYEKSIEKYLTPKEVEANKIKQQTQADALRAEQVKKYRETTHSFVQEEIRDLNERNEERGKSVDIEVQYTAALNLLNDAYEKGAISIGKYEQARKHLEHFRTLAQDKEDIVKTKQDVQDAFATLVTNEGALYSAQLANRIAIQQGDKQAVAQTKATMDELAKGNDALNEKLIAAQLAYHKALEKEASDRILLNKSADQQIKDNWRKIVDELIDIAKEFTDAQYEHRLEALQRETELIDKQYQHEISAIQESSLAQKDKTALMIQLKAQEDLANEESVKKARKLRHDQAIADKAFVMAKIIWDTEGAIAKVLYDTGSIPLAVTVGILGALALAKVAATAVPALAEGITNWKGGKALVGEAGTEIIQEPNRPAYQVSGPTVKYLPRGTDVIPTYGIPSISEKRIKDDSWEQTKYLASAIIKSNEKNKAKINNTINVDLGFELYKYKLLYGK